MKLEEWWKCSDEARIAKYWAAKQMTLGIESCTFKYTSYDGEREFKFIVPQEEFNYCQQLFKKEWFRK